MAQKLPRIAGHTAEEIGVQSTLRGKAQRIVVRLRPMTAGVNGTEVDCGHVPLVCGGTLGIRMDHAAKRRLSTVLTPTQATPIAQRIGQMHPAPTIKSGLTQ
jgi:hypothetical protein